MVDAWLQVSCGKPIRGRRETKPGPVQGLFKVAIPHRPANKFAGYMDKVRLRGLFQYLGSRLALVSEGRLRLCSPRIYSPGGGWHRL